MSQTWFIVINPSAGNGRAIKKWPTIKSEFEAQNIPFKYGISKHKTNIFTLVQNAINKGFKKIVCIGGDGTIHQVINAVMTRNDKDNSNIKVAVIPIGTGNDWARTYTIPKNIKSAVLLIRKEHTIRQDIGQIEFSNKKIYFNNLAGIGFDGFVVKKIHQYKKLGTLSYLIAALTSLLSYKKVHLKATFNNRIIHKPSLMLLIGLCKYSGGGMQLTKDVHIADGLFDISYIEKITLLELLFNLSKLFNGKITDHRFVKTFKTSSIKISTSKHIQAYIQADGELLPSDDFKITILPKAINFVVS